MKMIRSGNWTLTENHLYHTERGVQPCGPRQEAWKTVYGSLEFPVAPPPEKDWPNVAKPRRRPALGKVVVAMTVDWEATYYTEGWSLGDVHFYASLMQRIKNLEDSLFKEEFYRRLRIVEEKIKKGREIAAAAALLVKEQWAVTNRKYDEKRAAAERERVAQARALLVAEGLIG